MSSVEPLEYNRALYDFAAEEKAELKLTQGDRVAVLAPAKDGDSWLLVASADGAVGFVPKNFLGPDTGVRAAAGLGVVAPPPPPPPPPASVKPLSAGGAAAAVPATVHGTMASRPPPPPPPTSNLAPLAPRQHHAAKDQHQSAGAGAAHPNAPPPILKS